MTPLQLFVLLLVILIAIILIDRVYRRRRARMISTLGEEFHMHYSPLDRFALTERLMTLPQWTMRAADLSVKDVLYATRNGMRCFVATVKCRWSLDEDMGRFIVRIDEVADHGGNVTVTAETSTRPQDDRELYRRLLALHDVGDQFVAPSAPSPSGSAGS